MNKVLLDTNILVYAIDIASTFHHKSITFIDEFEGELYITAKNTSEFLTATNRGDEPMLSVKQALDEIEGFQKFASILFPDENSLTKFKGLLNRYHPKGKKIHDYEIAAIALSNGIIQLATFNGADFLKLDEVEVIEP